MSAKWCDKMQSLHQTSASGSSSVDVIIIKFRFYASESMCLLLWHLNKVSRQPPRWQHAKSQLCRPSPQEPELPFTLRRLSTASETMCACCRLLFEDGFSGTYFISLSISYFSDNYCQMTWHRTTMQAGKGGETGIFINIYFHRKLQFFSFRSPLPALFIVARPKNKSSLLPRIFGGLSFVNLVNPPANIVWSCHSNYFKTLTCVFPRHSDSRGFARRTANERRAGHKIIYRKIDIEVFQQEARNIDSDLISRRHGGTWHIHRLWWCYLEAFISF